MATSVAGEKIRILIVDDIAETRENIRKLLQFESDMEVVGGARTGGEAIDLARETQPDVVLMDINMPDMDGISATKALLDDVPYAQIVILSVNNEPDYMRRAMLAGARDFIAKPPSPDELISTIRVVSERAREQKKKLAAPAPQAAAPVSGMGFAGPARPAGKAIAVYSAKGGVGVTTLATNLAVGLHTVETPAVLVDTCLQFGDVSVFLNGRWVREVRSDGDSDPFEITRFLQPGANKVTLVATKRVAGAVRRSNSRDQRIEVLLGEGSAGGGTVYLGTPLVTMTRNASETETFTEEHDLVAR
jgi:CheY-like chemotaxis protein